MDIIIITTIVSIPLVSIIGIIFSLRVISQINEQTKNRTTVRDINIKYICSLNDCKKGLPRFNWKQNKGFVYEPNSGSQTFLS